MPHFHVLVRILVRIRAICVCGQQRLFTLHVRGLVSTAVLAAHTLSCLVSTLGLRDLTSGSTRRPVAAAQLVQGRPEALYAHPRAHGRAAGSRARQTGGRAVGVSPEPDPAGARFCGSSAFSLALCLAVWWTFPLPLSVAGRGGRRRGGTQARPQSPVRRAHDALQARPRPSNEVQGSA